MIEFCYDWDGYDIIRHCDDEEDIRIAYLLKSFIVEIIGCFAWTRQGC